MQVGIAIDPADPWTFFEEIYSDLRDHHPTKIFRTKNLSPSFLPKRINQYLLNRDLFNFMRKHDVVLFEWAGALLSTATQLPKTTSIITRLHRYEMYSWADKIQWDKVDKIILVTKAKQAEFSARFPEHGSKTIVIPESVSPRKFLPKSKAFKGDIGILCHLTPRKRVYELILSFYELIRKEENFHLHIAGGCQQSYEDYYLALRRIVRELNLERKVTFYGRITEPWEWYHLIDIFVSNSYSEGLQVAPMEAMASGCFCLSHRWEGADELLPQENLYLTGTELQQKILSYSAMPNEEKQSIKEQMRAIIMERFNIEQTRIKIRQVVEELGMH